MITRTFLFFLFLPGRLGAYVVMGALFCSCFACDGMLHSYARLDAVFSFILDNQSLPFVVPRPMLCCLWSNRNLCTE